MNIPPQNREGEYKYNGKTTKKEQKKKFRVTYKRMGALRER
jgi:hypothetical protein